MVQLAQARLSQPATIRTTAHASGYEDLPMTCQVAPAVRWHLRDVASSGVRACHGSPTVKRCRRGGIGRRKHFTRARAQARPSSSLGAGTHRTTHESPSCIRRSLSIRCKRTCEASAADFAAPEEPSKRRSALRFSRSLRNSPGQGSTFPVSLFPFPPERSHGSPTSRAIRSLISATADCSSGSASFQRSTNRL